MSFVRVHVPWWQVSWHRVQILWLIVWFFLQRQAILQQTSKQLHLHLGQNQHHYGLEGTCRKTHLQSLLIACLRPGLHLPCSCWAKLRHDRDMRKAARWENFFPHFSQRTRCCFPFFQGQTVYMHHVCLELRWAAHKPTWKTMRLICRFVGFLGTLAELWQSFPQVVGMILLNTFGPRLVQQSIERPDWGVESKAGHSESTHFTSHRVIVSTSGVNCAWIWAM